MEESYCGRSCRECTKREVIRCYGCKTEMINNLGNDCELANCAHEKGLESCRLCENKGNCSGLKTREEMPDYQKRKGRAVFCINRDEEKNKAEKIQKATVLGEWLWLIFLRCIPNVLVFFISLVPVFTIFGELIGVLITTGVGLIFFLKLSPAQIKYRTTGICWIFLAIFALLDIILGRGTQLSVWSVFSASTLIYAQYNEWNAHAMCLEGIDDHLAGKWRSLWGWNIGLMLGLVVCIPLSLLSVILGEGFAYFIVFGCLGIAIGVVVVGILSWFYLYKTVKAFRRYAST